MDIVRGILNKTWLVQILGKGEGVILNKTWLVVCIAITKPPSSVDMLQDQCKRSSSGKGMGKGKGRGDLPL